MNYCAAKLINNIVNYASIFLSQLGQKLGNEDEDPRFPDEPSSMIYQYRQNILLRPHFPNYCINFFFH